MWYSQVTAHASAHSSSCVAPAIEFNVCGLRLSHLLSFHHQHASGRSNAFDQSYAKQGLTCMSRLNGFSGLPNPLIWLFVVSLTKLRVGFG